MYFTHQRSELEQVNAATLAYLGDAVFELLVRERLLSEGVLRSNRLHRRALRLSSATGQAAAAKALLPLLSEREAAVFRRGRNAALSISKKKNPAIHTAASGLEVLFGWLYLEGQEQRLLELFDICYTAVAERERA